MERELQQK